MAYKDKEKALRYRKKWQLLNKERLVAQAKEYYLKNKTKIDARQLIYASKNKEKIKGRGRKYRIKNRLKLAKQSKEYYLNHKQEHKNYCKIYNSLGKSKECKRKYRLSHKKEMKIYQEKHYQKNKQKKYATYLKRYYDDTSFKLRKNFQCQIRNSLKSIGNNKSGRKWEDIVGYDKETLKEHLFIEPPYKKEFLTGKLDIDHKTPITWFNYSSEEDLAFKTAWALDNLQLLPTKDNNEKGNRYCSDVMLALSQIGRC